MSAPANDLDAAMLRKLALGMLTCHHFSFIHPCRYTCTLRLIKHLANFKVIHASHPEMTPSSGYGEPEIIISRDPTRLRTYAAVVSVQLNRSGKNNIAIWTDTKYVKGLLLHDIDALRCLYETSKEELSKRVCNRIKGELIEYPAESRAVWRYMQIDGSGDGPFWSDSEYSPCSD